MKGILANKALLIGGGATAATTAVVVPVVVTQTSSSEEPRVPSFSTKLSIENESFYDDFNNPGDCIKRLFPGVEKSNFFTREESESDDHGNIEKKEIFSSEQPADPDLACYIYNKDGAKKIRIEKAIKRDTEGWVFMSGVKPDGSNKKVWFREFYVEDNGTDWEVKFGHEGEIPHSTSYAPSYPNDWQEGFRVPVKEIDAIGMFECVEGGEPCGEIRARAGYWKPKDNGKKLVETATNSGTQVPRWSTNGKAAMQNKDNRKRIYKDGQWFTYKEPTSNKNKILFSLDDAKAAHRLGEWKDLRDICTNEEKHSDEDRDVFCK